MAQLEVLTPEHVAKIDAEVAKIARHGFGSVTLIIERGRVRWLQAAVSTDLGTTPALRPAEVPATPAA